MKNAPEAGREKEPTRNDEGTVTGTHKGQENHVPNNQSGEATKFMNHGVVDSDFASVTGQS